MPFLSNGLFFQQQEYSLEMPGWVYLDGAVVSQSNRTHQMWIKPDSIAGNPTLVSMLIENGFSIELNSSGNVIVNMARDVTGNFIKVTTASGVSAGVWTRLTVVIDTAGNDIAVYFNGVSQTLISEPATFGLTFSMNRQLLGAKDGDATMPVSGGGGNVPPTNVTANFAGKIYQYVVYNDVKSHSELANGSSPKPTRELSLLSNCVLCFDTTVNKLKKDLVDDDTWAATVTANFSTDVPV